jgi:hypothetical protein
MRERHRLGQGNRLSKDGAGANGSYQDSAYHAADPSPAKLYQRVDTLRPQKRTDEDRGRERVTPR